MDEITECRKKIDELDRKLVQLISERAECAREIGRLKRNTQMPIYEPDREKTIFANVCAANRGPLPDRMLLQVYERLIDVMRQVQKQEFAPKGVNAGENEIEAEVNE